MDLLTLLGSIFLTWFILLWILSLLGHYLAHTLSSSSNKPLSKISKDQLPGITILRPLSGLDENLWENLESVVGSCCSGIGIGTRGKKRNSGNGNEHEEGDGDENREGEEEEDDSYPSEKVEVIYCIRNRNDLKALKVVRELVEKWQGDSEESRTLRGRLGWKGDMRVVVGDDPNLQLPPKLLSILSSDSGIINPKIANLLPGYALASHDLVWVLDSNAIVARGALRRSIEPFIRPEGHITMFGSQAIDNGRMKSWWWPFYLFPFLSGVSWPASNGSSIAHRPRFRTGFVHHLPFAVYPSTSLGARVEQCFLSCTHAKMYLAINSLEVDSCVNGKSNMFRRSDLEAAVKSRHEWEDKRRNRSGIRQNANDAISQPLKAPDAGVDEDGAVDLPALAYFSKYLGEDNMIGSTLWHYPPKSNPDLPLIRHSIPSGVIVGNTVGSMALSTYFFRRVRWIRVRKYMVGVSTAVEPFTECFLCGFVGALGAGKVLNLSWSKMLLWWIVNLVVWFCMDVTLFYSLERLSPVRYGSGTTAFTTSPSSKSEIGPPRRRRRSHDGPGYEFLTAWLAREALALPIWLFAMLGDGVSWRATTPPVKANGVSPRETDEAQRQSSTTTIMVKYKVKRNGEVDILDNTDGSADEWTDRLWRWGERWWERRQEFGAGITI